MIEPRLIDAERTLVAARWLLLTAVLLLAHLAQPELTALWTVYAVVAAAAAYNLAYAILLRRRYLPQVITEVTVLVETLFCGVAVMLTGGRESPIIPLLVWPVVGAAFRLGLAEALAAAIVGSLITVYLFVFPTGLVEPGFVVPAAIVAVYLFLAAFLINTLFQKTFSAGEGGLDQERATAREATARLATVSTQAQAIAEVSSVLSGTLNYQRVLETILSESNKLLTFDIGIVFLFDPGGADLRVAADRGLTVNERQLRVSPAGGALSRAVQMGEPAVLPSPAKDEELQRFGSLADSRSGLCVPLHAGFEMFGAVLLASKAKDAFSHMHMDLLLALCNQAVLAMHNARLYDSLRKERDRVVQNDEEARKRVARDLHDGPVQLVAAMAMKSEIIKRIAAADPPRLAEELEALAEMSHRASRDLRTVLFELRPVMLESHGLVATLKEYVQKMKDSQNAPLRLEASGFKRRLPVKAESTIFAIVQEAVNNAIKHAEAKNIWIRLAEREGALTVVVEDDGRGFDVASVEGSYGKRGSLGLLNMHERAEMVDGLLSLRSQPNAGTTLTLRIPLTDAPLPSTSEPDNAASPR